MVARIVHLFEAPVLSLSFYGKGHLTFAKTGFTFIYMRDSGLYFAFEFELSTGYFGNNTIDGQPVGIFALGTLLPFDGQKTVLFGDGGRTEFFPAYPL